MGKINLFAIDSQCHSFWKSFNETFRMDFCRRGNGFYFFSDSKTDKQAGGIKLHALHSPYAAQTISFFSFYFSFLRFDWFVEHQCCWMLLAILFFYLWLNLLRGIRLCAGAVVALMTPNEIASISQMFLGSLSPTLNASHVRILWLVECLKRNLIILMVKHGCIVRLLSARNKTSGRRHYSTVASNNM